MHNRVIVYNPSEEQRTELMRAHLKEEIVTIVDVTTDEMKILFERNGVVVARIAGGGIADANEIREACNDNFNTNYTLDE